MTTGSGDEAVRLDVLPLTVVARRAVAEGIDEFTLEAPDGAALPPYAPGAHVTVRTPDGAMRRYSLAGDGSDASRYTLGIKREPGSRGGSTSMHERAIVGTVLDVTRPDNDFELVDADEYLLIAGGIGITPIRAMATALAARGKPFELLYCTRDRALTAWADELEAAFGERLVLHHDGGELDRLYDFWDRFETVRCVQVYCCGPAALMEDVRAVSGHWPPGRVRFEEFATVDVVRDDDAPFEVELGRGARTLVVPADRSLLEALRDVGIRTVSSCESGTCGTCRCGYLEGDVEHRDRVLMDDERDRYLMPCVSRARGRLVLDL